MNSTSQEMSKSTSQPRVLKTFYRIYIQKSQLEETKAFYLALQCLDQVHHEFYYPEYRLTIVGVGSFLLIAGDSADTQRFEATRLTCLVDDIESLRTYFKGNRVEIVNDLKIVPSGRNLRARSLDGTLIEYVQHSEEFQKKMSDLNKSKSVFHNEVD
jgi:hypothetical protein